MRLFYAVQLMPAAEERTLAIQAAARERLGEGALRWVQPQALHLSLRFLGETDPSRLDAALEAGREAAVGVCSFYVAVGGAAWLPATSRPHVLCLPVFSDRLLELHERLESALARRAWPREARSFHGHVTLARTRYSRGDEVRRAATSLNSPSDGIDINFGFVVDRFTLMESTLLPGGPQYRAEQVFRLKAAERAESSLEAPSTKRP